MQTGSSVDSCYNAVDSERPRDSVWRLCHPEGIGGEEALGQKVELKKFKKPTVQQMPAC